MHVGSSYTQHSQFYSPFAANSSEGWVKTIRLWKSTSEYKTGLTLSRQQGITMPDSEILSKPSRYRLMLNNCASSEFVALTTVGFAIPCWNKKKLFVSGDQESCGRGDPCFVTRSPCMRTTTLVGTSHRLLVELSLGNAASCASERDVPLSDAR